MRRAISLMVLLAACHAGHQAETLSQPFPGQLLSIRSAGRCTRDGCPFEYRSRITNPTQIDANVQECILPTAGIRLPIMGIAGFGIPAQVTKTIRSRFLLPVKKGATLGWTGRDLSCLGLDWHGDPPI
jgi:hypothetical protein